MKTIDKKPLNRVVKIAVIISRFNEPVTNKLHDSAVKRLEELGLYQHAEVIWVPGAVEIPLVAKRLAESKQYDAIVCLGAVIRGETTHYDYVCDQVSQGCQQVMMENNLPVVFGVLTTENGEQAFARAGGAHSDKGIESIDAALHMISICDQID